MLEVIETGVAILILSVIAMAAANTLAKAKISTALMEEAVPYQQITADFNKTLLVLGDSTGVGIGADTPEDTVAGRLAKHIQATYVENYAVSGAAVADLPTQIQKIKLAHYDFILIHIGGNDILAFHDAKKTVKQFGEIMETLPDAGHIYVMSAGNVGGATIFPHVLRPFHTWKTLAFHKQFGKVVPEHQGVYVNLYQHPWRDPFLKDAKRYLAADGLHPSSEGYGLWFETLKRSVDAGT